MTLTAWTYVPYGYASPDLYLDLDYSEQINSGAVQISPGNSSITRIFYVRDDRVPNFLDDLLGYSEVTAGAVTRILPDTHPVFNNLYATDATVEHMGLPAGSLQNANKTAKSLCAKVTAVYKPADYEVVADTGATDELYRFVSRSMVPAAEYFSVDATGMYYVNKKGSDGKNMSMSTPPQKLTGTAEITMTWHVVPPNPATSNFIPPNMSAITNCLGKVHVPGGVYTAGPLTNFDAAHFNFPPGTVLFTGCEPRLVTSRVTIGADTYSYYWEIQFKLMYKNGGLSSLTSEYAGWQYIWDQANKRYDLVTTDGTQTGNRLYQEADLNGLFSIG